MKTKLSVFVVMCLFLVMFVAQGFGDKVDLKKVADEILKAMNSGDVAAVCKYYAEDAVMTVSGESEPVKGRKAIEENTTAWFSAFSIKKMEFPTVLVSDNYIVIEMSWEGTHSGAFITPEGEIPASGRNVSLQGIMILKTNAEGLITEDRTYYDTADFMKQLGLLE
jgi:steroid delta-isomerase-like uncharacterized protein